MVSIDRRPCHLMSRVLRVTVYCVVACAMKVLMSYMPTHRHHCHTHSVCIKISSLILGGVFRICASIQVALSHPLCSPVTL